MATEGFAAEISAVVEQIKANVEERKSYMTLAMDIQMHIDREKGGWFAEGKVDGSESVSHVVIVCFFRIPEASHTLDFLR